MNPQKILEYYVFIKENERPNFKQKIIDCWTREHRLENSEELFNNILRRAFSYEFFDRGKEVSLKSPKLDVVHPAFAENKIIDIIENYLGAPWRARVYGDIKAIVPKITPPPNDTRSL